MCCCKALTCEGLEEWHQVLQIAICGVKPTVCMAGLAHLATCKHTTLECAIEIDFCLERAKLQSAVLTYLRFDYTMKRLEPNALLGGAESVT